MIEVSEEKIVDEYKEKFNLLADTFSGGKSSKIEKINYMEGFEVLGIEIFPQSQLPFDEQALKAVGVEFVASWITKYWSELNTTTKKLFIKVVQTLPNTETVRRFYVLLCASLAKEDMESAIELLGGVCMQQGISPKVPTFKIGFCSLLRMILLDSQKSVLLALPLNVNTSGANDIALYGLAASFLMIKSKTSDFNIQFKVLRWVSQAKLQLTVPEELQRAIKNSSLAEPSNIPRIQAFLPTFPEKIEFLGEANNETVVENVEVNKTEVQTTREDVNKDNEDAGTHHSNQRLLPGMSDEGGGGNGLAQQEGNHLLSCTEKIKKNETDVSGGKKIIENGKNRTAEPKIKPFSSKNIESLGDDTQDQSESLNIGPRSSTNETTIWRRAKKKKTFILFDAVQEIGSYLNELEIHNSHCELKIAELLEENKKLKEENKALQNVRAKIEDKSSDLSRKLHGIREDLSKTTDELNRTKNQNEDLRKRESQKSKQIEEFKELLKTEKKNAEDECRRLSKKIDPLSDQKVVEFKNRIIDGLKPDYLDLREAKDLEMTKNVGNNLLSLLCGIFEKLKNEGLDFI